MSDAKTTKKTFTYPSSYEAWEEYSKEPSVGARGEIPFKAGFVCGRMGVAGTEPTKISKAVLIDMIEKLEDLKKQATIEHSHFYVNGVATEAIGLLYNLLGYYHAEK